MHKTDEIAGEPRARLDIGERTIVRLNAQCFRLLMDIGALPCDGHVEMVDGILIVRGEYAYFPIWKDRPRLVFSESAVPTAPLSQNDFDLLLKAGLLSPNWKFELIDGIPYESQH